MKKPEHQWQTAGLVAVRTEAPGGAWADDARAEAFVLRHADGAEGRAVLGLHRQWVDAVSAEDPDVAFAVRCWLAARGARRIELMTEPTPRGAVGLDVEAQRVLQRGPFSVADLSDPPADTPRRIVTLAPSNAEMVHALGCFDRVIACEDSSDYPPEVQACERLGPDLGPDLDRIAVLAPDLVISSLTVPGMERIVSGLRARGVPQLVSAPRRYAEVIAEIESLGRVLGVPDRAAEVVADMQRQRAELEASAPARPVRVYLEWWPRPMFTPGADCYSNELIAIAGGVNVFSDRPGSSVQIEAADLVAADPEVCFVSWCGVAEDKLDPKNVIGRPGLETLPAARGGHVYVLDEAFSGRPGPRMLEASRRMRAAIEAAGLGK